MCLKKRILDLIKILNIPLIARVMFKDFVDLKSWVSINDIILFYTTQLGSYLVHVSPRQDHGFYGGKYSLLSNNRQNVCVPTRCGKSPTLKPVSPIIASFCVTTREPDLFSFGFFWGGGD